MEAQSAPDSPEALATIPALGIEDLPRENALLPRAVAELPETFLTHELPTQGIAYATLLLPLANVPDRLVPLLPLFARSLTETGTAKRDFTELGALMQRISSNHTSSYAAGIFSWYYFAYFTGACGRELC